MKKWIISFAAVTVLALVLGVIIAGCVTKSQAYGKEVSENKVLTIKEIETNNADYDGESVKIKGKITEVCQDMGCWFKVKDGTGIMYVDLEMGRNFTIPKNSGKQPVVVEGKFVNDNGFLKIKGSGLKIGED